MCGIITIVKKEEESTPTYASILGMLTGQQHRGTQGFGYVAFDERIKSYTRRETRLEIEKPLKLVDAKSIMFHHRYPTSTPNYADCAHPIKVSHKELLYDYYFIHNGMISNHSLLHQQHIGLGYEYQTTVKASIVTKNTTFNNEKYNDSEALAIDVCRFIEGKQTEIESRGSIAFVCLQVHKKSDHVIGVFWGRNSSPLTIKITDKSLVLRSEGELDDVKPNVMYRLDIKKWKVDEEEVEIGEIMSVKNNWDNYDYHDYTNYEEDDFNMVKNHRVGSEEAIISEYVGSETEKIDEEIGRIDEHIGILMDSMDYYRDEGEHEKIKETNAEIGELETKIQDLEAKKQQIIDENGGGTEDPPEDDSGFNKTIDI